MVRQNGIKHEKAAGLSGKISLGTSWGQIFSDKPKAFPLFFRQYQYSRLRLPSETARRNCLAANQKSLQLIPKLQFLKPKVCGFFRSMYIRTETFLHLMLIICTSITWLLMEALTCKASWSNLLFWGIKLHFESCCLPEYRAIFRPPMRSSEEWWLPRCYGQQKRQPACNLGHQPNSWERLQNLIWVGCTCTYLEIRKKKRREKHRKYQRKSLPASPPS